MDCHETCATCPRCLTAFALEYVTNLPSQRATSINVECPSCEAGVYLNLPRPAIGFAARRMGTASLLKPVTAAMR
jgi:hypothetical protein